MQHDLGVEGNGMLLLARYGHTQHIELHDLLRLSICVSYDTCHHATFERRRRQGERLQTAQHKEWRSPPRLEPSHFYPFDPALLASSSYTHTNTSTDTSHPSDRTRSFQPLIPTNPFELTIFVVKHRVEIEGSRDNPVFAIWKHGAEKSLIWPDCDLKILGRCNEAVSTDIKGEISYTHDQCFADGMA
ncbi:hypothetical protein Q7P36_002313 [Cladosporium allicinum]